MNPNNRYNFPPRRVTFVVTQNPEHAGTDMFFATEAHDALDELGRAIRDDDGDRLDRGIGRATGTYVADNGVRIDWRAWDYEDTWQWRLRRAWLRLKLSLGGSR